MSLVGILTGPRSSRHVFCYVCLRFVLPDVFDRVFIYCFLIMFNWIIVCRNDDSDVEEDFTAAVRGPKNVSIASTAVLDVRILSFLQFFLLLIISAQFLPIHYVCSTLLDNTFFFLLAT